MVAEAIREELRTWRPGQGGIAALSFTRVGGEEVRGALGENLGHPHFVGTIDAFLFRYVVRPHLRAIDPQAKTPELIAADWQPAEIWTSHTVGQGINPYACVWIGRDNTNAAVLAQVNKYGVITVLGPREREAVLEFKRKLRRDHGRITLSDSALFASVILSHRDHGAVLRAEIARRFPLVIVDELQDTGVFLSESIRTLLGQPEARGLLVGDPDQSIYEFNGADPSMFDSFASLAGAEVFKLRSTRRCPAAVARVASDLKRSGGALEPADGRDGQAFLIQYGDLVRDVSAIARALRHAGPGDLIKIVARGNATVQVLTGRSGGEVPSLNCRPAALMHRAVQYFRRGRTVTALAAARTAMELVIAGGEGFTDEQLRGRRIEPTEFKALAVRCLLAADALPATGSALEWQTAALGRVEAEAATFCTVARLTSPQPRRRPSRRKGHDKPVAASIPSSATAESSFGGAPVLTVHGVKGETHDVTIFVVPPTTGRGSVNKCPSALWWPTGEADDEERRVAYVALTRTRRDLLVCVDEPTLRRLKQLRPEFVTGFQCLTVSEFLERLA